MLISRSNLLILIEGMGLFWVVVILPAIREDILEEYFITLYQKLFDEQWHTGLVQN